MKVLVTGGCGFIGSNLVRMLINNGHVVLNFDKLTYAGNRQSLAEFNSNPNYQLLVGDICDFASVKSAIRRLRPDWLMHLAAESHVDRSIDGPREFIETNIVGAFNLLQASLEYWRTLEIDSARSFRYLHVSTDEVYGSLGAFGLFTEETRYDPHSPYSASKASSDHLARAWHDTYGLPVLVTNCSNNYGPYQFPEKLIPVVILKCLRGELIPVYGDGENIRDWLYVEDHCEALSMVLEKGSPGETYNIGGNNEKKNIDLVTLLCLFLDELYPRRDRNSYTSQIANVPDRPGHDRRYAIDSSKIKRELGWSPKQDHESGFRKTVQWYLDNQSWWNAILGDFEQIEPIRIAMILLLGGTGYIGSAFRRLFDDKAIPYRSISRSEVDYTQRDTLIQVILDSRAKFLINAAGYTGIPNVDACELHKTECLFGNAVLPGIIRDACEHCKLPWGQVSSGCIYTGAKPDGSGFTEADSPNFCFRTNNCSFYSGCKALSEECLEHSETIYAWRLRIPFNHIDSNRNYLSKLMRYERLLNATNSISQLDEFVSACWECRILEVPFGTYNITNTGFVTTREIVSHIKKHFHCKKEFKFFDSEEQFMSIAAKTPRSNCVLDNSKLRSTGIAISDVHDAIEKALVNWQSTSLNVVHHTVQF